MKSTREYLEEAKKKYPSQYDAEFLLDYIKSIESLSSSGAGSSITKLHARINNIHMTEWTKVFGDKSPWKVDGIGKKSKVVWDGHKANRLGINDSQG